MICSMYDCGLLCNLCVFAFRRFGQFRFGDEGKVKQDPSVVQRKRRGKSFGLASHPEYLLLSRKCNLFQLSPHANINLALC